MTKTKLLDEYVKLCREFVALKEAGNATRVSRPEYRTRYNGLFDRMKALLANTPS